MPSEKPGRSLKHRLEDILLNIDAARSFTTGCDFAGFMADAKARYAAVRAPEIISEASRHVSNEIKARHSDIPWRNIAAAGNLYRHQYDGVDDMFVWDVIARDLEPLRVVVEQELSRLKG